MTISDDKLTFSGKKESNPSVFAVPNNRSVNKEIKRQFVCYSVPLVLFLKEAGVTQLESDKNHQEYGARFLNSYKLSKALKKWKKWKKENKYIIHKKI